MLLQIKIFVHAGNLFCIAIEQCGLSFAELAEPSLFSLAPARMIHFRVYVGVKSVFFWG